MSSNKTVQIWCHFFADSDHSSDTYTYVALYNVNIPT